MGLSDSKDGLLRVGMKTLAITYRGKVLDKESCWERYFCPDG